MARSSFSQWINSLVHRRKARQRTARELRPALRSLRLEPLETRQLLAGNIIIATGGLSSIPAGALTFNDANDYTIDPSAFSTVSANVALEATYDITFQNDLTMAGGYSLTALAGTSILVDARLTAGDLTLSANQTLGASGGAISDNGSGSIAATGTVTLNTSGAIGSSTNRIQFDATGTPAAVVVGNVLQPSGVYLAGLGDLTLNEVNMSGANGNLDATALGNLTVAAGATIDTGSGTISLAADTFANGSGYTGRGTHGVLSIGAGAAVDSSNTSASGITLRGADVNIATGSDPAVVGASRQVLATTPTAELQDVGDTDAMAFDSHGDLFVASAIGDVTEYAPGSTTPMATLTGVACPDALAFDSHGDLFVANDYNEQYLANGTVSEFAPGSTTPTGALYGPGFANALAFDASGDLFVSNATAGDTIVGEYAPGSTTPTATLTGLYGPDALAFDSSGNLFVANAGNNTVSEFAPGHTTPTATLTGLDYPDALAFDSHGNLFVSNGEDTADPANEGTTVSEFAPGSTTPTTTLTGLYHPAGLAFDSSGNLFVANSAGYTVSEFAPGTTTPIATLTGLAGPSCLAFDSSGDLFVGGWLAWGGITAEFTSTLAPSPVGVVIRSSLATLPMNIGGGSPGEGINLTNAALAQVETTATGTITFGDSTQIGDITFTSATPATTVGAGTVVVQSTTGAGQIVLDDDGGAGMGLDSSGGTVTLTPGTGGIVTPLSATGVPLATQGFNASGLTLTPTLSFVPTADTQLTVINNTATPAAGNPILGTFANLPQGGMISASYGGTTYAFRADYAGGDGNDLVLTFIGIANGSTPGLYDPTSSWWFLRDSNTAGGADNMAGYGPPAGNWVPLVGDWTGDGTDTLGLYDPATGYFYLHNSNATGTGEIAFFCGDPSQHWIPVVGDWTGQKSSAGFPIDTVGLYDPKTCTWYLRNELTTGVADITIGYGPAGAGCLPVVGDWDGNGTSTIGLYNPATGYFFLRNSNTTGMADITFFYGDPTQNWTPVVGDWNGDGHDSIGMYDPATATWYLRNELTTGAADMTFGFGWPHSGWIPVAGDWIGASIAPALAANSLLNSATGSAPLVRAASQPIVAAAVVPSAAGDTSPTLPAATTYANYVASNLPGIEPGQVEGSTAVVEQNAAGQASCIDPTLVADEEFTRLGSGSQAINPHAVDQVAASGDLDLSATSLTSGMLSTRVPRFPGATEVGAILAEPGTL
jgi:hypothetical protein